MKLKDKVAIVTGGGQGIGEEIVRLFAKEGASVAIVDKAEEGMKKVANELRFKHGNVIEIKADVTNSSDIERIVKEIMEKFGKIDILVNNAGTIFPVDFLEISDDNWNFIQNVDLKGLVMCTKNVAPHMIKQKYGKIVNISSMAAFGVYMPGFASYSAAKSAVNSFTQHAARELGPYGINVNAVAPGEILTSLTYKNQTKEEVEKKLINSKNMTMVKRLGNTRDVANLVLFLVSDESSFITAEIISVDGGRVDRM